jgi:outer membrane lipoprotein-sorting protein
MVITMLLRVALLLTGLGFLASAPDAQERRAPDEIARALQARYQGIRDFSADFVQTYRGGVLRTQTSERGTVAIKKPGRMRWIYTSPERKEFVSDGQKVYSYLIQDRQVIIAPLPPDDQATTPALFLTGKGDIYSLAEYCGDQADTQTVGVRIRVPGRDHRSGDPPDPSVDHPGPPGRRFHPYIHEPEGKHGNIR